MKYIIIYLIFGILCYCIGTYQTSLPVVQWSSTQDICVEVISGDEDLNCSNMPKKYHKIWVQ